MSDQQEKPTNFAAYMIEQVLSDPRTRSLIGCSLRWLLHAAGVALAARPVGHMLQGAASNADWIMLASGGILSAAQLVWGLWQKFESDRTIKTAKATAQVVINAADAVIAARSLPPVSEIKP